MLSNKVIKFLGLSILLLFVISSSSLVMAQKKLEPEEGHPRASYSGYSDREIKLQTEAIRQMRPQMHRGGWEWDRLLERYIDSGRRDSNEIRIIKGYFLSILDRYQEAKENGKKETKNPKG